MANGIFDICKRRPASFRAQVSVNGERQMMDLCDEDYRKLARQKQRSGLAVESLFGGGSLLDDFFGDSPFGNLGQRLKKAAVSTSLSQAAAAGYAKSGNDRAEADASEEAPAK